MVMRQRLLERGAINSLGRRLESSLEGYLRARGAIGVMEINPEIIITGVVSLGVAVLVHFRELRNARQEVQSKADLKGSDSMQTQLSETRRELNEQRQANVDLRDLNYKAAIENRDLTYDNKYKDAEIARLKEEILRLEAIVMGTDAIPGRGTQDT